jgi:MFS family permease
MLAAAQFIMVLDTTVINVSITQVAADLNTIVVGLRTAISMYTLVMAAFMLLGDRWGAKRAFIIGLLVYGLGSLTTAFSRNLGMLLVGWSFIEEFGAILVIPAIAALTAGTYTGRQRALAYGILGGVSGASAALVPLIGGWVTTPYSWRLVFAAETFVLPLYLQSVLGYDALQAGIVLLPLSLSLLVFALGGARLAGRYSPQRVAAAGLLGMLSGLILLVAFTGPDLRSASFTIALALVGAGNGLLVSQLATSSCHPFPPSGAVRLAACRGRR